MPAGLRWAPALVLAMALAMALTACARAADSPAPPAPDYAQAAAWAAWPGRAGSADTVPPGLDHGFPDDQRAANLASLPAVRAGADLRPPLPNLTGARCQGAALEVAIPWGNSGGFVNPLTLFGSYHIFDYKLFYTNIRINAQQRLAAWRAAHTS